MRKLLASEVVAFSDAELDDYLEECLKEKGEKLIDVEDPDNLPESFIDRLRDRCRPTTEDVTNSKPIDLDQVATRLMMEVRRSRSPFFDFGRDQSGPTPPTPPLRPRTEAEKQEYQDLVNDGGRPCYPIDLLEQVSSNPTAFNETLRPWQQFPDAETTDWHVFQLQYWHWRMFRQWQKINRRDRAHIRDPIFPEVYRAYVNFRRTFQPESGWLPEYTEALKTLLAQQGFTREFQLHEDPAQQNLFTTWIEYYAYECSQFTLHVNEIKYLQPTFDDAWNELLRSNVLEPSETQEYILSRESRIERGRAEHQASSSLEAAQAAADAVFAPYKKNGNNINNIQDLRLTPLEQQRVRAAISRLDEAKATHKRITEHNWNVGNFHVAIRDYKDARRMEKWYRALLQWILDEMYVIEDEMGKPKGADTEFKTPRGSKRKSVHVASETIAERPIMKRQKTYQMHSDNHLVSGRLNDQRQTGAQRGASKVEDSRKASEGKTGSEIASLSVLHSYLKGGNSSWRRNNGGLRTHTSSTSQGFITSPPHGVTAHIEREREFLPRSAKAQKPDLTSGAAPEIAHRPKKPRTGTTRVKGPYNIKRQARQGSRWSHEDTIELSSA